MKWKSSFISFKVNKGVPGFLLLYTISALILTAKLFTPNPKVVV